MLQEERFVLNIFNANLDKPEKRHKDPKAPRKNFFDIWLCVSVSW